MAGERSDVVVVGAGLAGAAAASDLAARGFSVTVVEARDRIGGRAYARPFADTDVAVEFGGAWITPWHTRIQDLAKKHGLELRPRHPVVERRWYRDGAVHTDGATAPADRGAHERALARVAADAMLLTMGHERDEKDRPLTGVSFADYVDRLQAPEATRALFAAWWCVSGNGDMRRVPAAEFLASCAYGDGTPDGIAEEWMATVSPSMAALAEAMLRQPAVRIEREAPVSQVVQGGDGVAVTVAVGRTFEARAAVLATGVNAVNAIEFDPPLTAGKQAAATHGHLGRAVKIWAKVTGVGPGVLSTGGDDGIRFMFSERETGDGATMIVGFGLAGDGIDPDDSSQVAAAVHRFFPEATLIGYDWHDWVADPFAKGTWVAPPLGAEAGMEALNWQPEGRLAFATSDFAPEQAGWFEAAVISGEAAADAVARMLG